MSRNKYQEQVWVLPKGDANRQIAEGFMREESVKERSIFPLPVAGGWPVVRDSFSRQYNDELLKYPSCVMVLIVDFDGQGTKRLETVLSGVAPALQDRVFVLGAYDEPEKLKAALGMSYKQIGKALAKECSNGTRTLWEHNMLAHNRGELARMVPHVRRILFG